jgi:hypothetical protein
VRRQIEARGIRAADDARHLGKCPVLQSEILQHGIERAVFPAMREGDVRDIEGDRIAGACLGQDVVRRHIMEAGERIDEATDEPGAGDAIDLRACSRNPGCRTRAVMDRGLPKMGIPCCSPALNSVDEMARLEAGQPQFGRCVLAYVVAVYASDDDAFVRRHIGVPSGDPFGVAMDAAAHHIRRCRKRGLSPDIDDQWLRSGSECPNQLSSGIE